MFYWKMSIALPRKTGGKGRWNIETDHDGVRLVTDGLRARLDSNLVAMASSVRTTPKFARDQDPFFGGYGCSLSCTSRKCQR